MSDPVDQPRTGRRVIAILLIVLGLYFLAAQLLPQGGLGLALLGGLLLAGYGLGGRVQGFLIAGCILLGLGLGMALNDLLGPGWWPLILLGLGLGFCAIPVGARDQAWALIPGGVLVLLSGLFLLTAQGVGFTREFWEAVGRWWPLILVALGAWILWRHWRLGPRR